MICFIRGSQPQFDMISAHRPMDHPGAVKYATVINIVLGGFYYTL